MAQAGARGIRVNPNWMHDSEWEDYERQKSKQNPHFLKSKHSSTYVCAQPVRHFPKADAEAVGEPLFLTPYIEAGQLEEARQLARVDPALLEVINRREKNLNFGKK